ncbi:MAG: universal stress protein [Syntrophaceae bacterium]|nr:universal stress protein [Syntrophaceae bacterium]
MFEKVLFPVDFSRHTERIVHRIPDLEGTGLQTAVFLHVIDPVKAARWTDVDEPALERYKTEADDRLKDLVEPLRTRTTIRILRLVAVGTTERAIIDAAEDQGASLIMMGAHGRSYIRGALLGSVTRNVLRRTRTPLLIARFENPEAQVEKDPNFFPRDPCEKILYPTDFSENALRAFRSVRTCRPGAAKEVIILHVQDSRSLLPYLKHRMEEFDRVDGERLSELKRQLDFLGFAVRTVLKTGVPATEISRLADEENVTMIAMASHGKSNVREALLGSVAEAVVEHHVRPVLVIPRELGHERREYG